MKKLIFILAMAFLLVMPLVFAGDFGARPEDKKDQLDFSAKIYTIKQDGIYSGASKVKTNEEAEVWIDKKIGNTYHVDSLIEQDVGVYLYLYYDIQPDTIEYKSHNGKYQQIYTYNDWEWEELEEGGNVILLVNLEYATGSNTFTSAISGATWMDDGIDVTLTENTDYTLSGLTFTISNINYAWNSINASYDYLVDGDAKTNINSTIQGKSTFADFWEIIVLAIVISLIIGLLLIVFSSKRNR